MTDNLAVKSHSLFKFGASVPKFSFSCPVTTHSCVSSRVNPLLHSLFWLIIQLCNSRAYCVGIKGLPPFSTVPQHIKRHTLLWSFLSWKLGREMSGKSSHHTEIDFSCATGVIKSTNKLRYIFQIRKGKNDIFCSRLFCSYNFVFFFRMHKSKGKTQNTHPCVHDSTAPWRTGEWPFQLPSDSSPPCLLGIFLRPVLDDRPDVQINSSQNFCKFPNLGIFYIENNIKILYFFWNYRVLGNSEKCWVNLKKILNFFEIGFRFSNRGRQGSPRLTM